MTIYKITSKFQIEEGINNMTEINFAQWEKPSFDPGMKKTKTDIDLFSTHAGRPSFNSDAPWKEIKTASTVLNPRYHHVSVMVDDCLYIHGGFENEAGVLADFKMFPVHNNQKNQWVSLSTQNGPGPRHSHTAVVHEDKIYVFGGKTDRFTSVNTVHAFCTKTKQWSLVQTFDPDRKVAPVPTQPKKANEPKQKQKIEPDAAYINQPGPIDSHQAVLVGDEMIVYGGFCSNEFTNDVYSLNLRTKIWKKIYDAKANHKSEEQPEPRCDFSMVAYQGKLYIFAGKNLSRSFADLWQFDPVIPKFTKVKSVGYELEKRSSHTAVVFQNYMVVFGGISSVTHERDDLLFYDFKEKTWVVAWANSEEKYAQKCLEKKITTETKTQLSKTKTIENSSFLKTKFAEEPAQKSRKYRRPLAEQKVLNRKTEVTVDKEKCKKNNERKYLLIRQIEETSKLGDSSEHYSPLIESLSNSIMLTSSTCQASQTSRDTVYSKMGGGRYEDECESISRKLKARDGHSAHVIKDEMLLFGGDRHMIALNDIVKIDLAAVAPKQGDSTGAKYQIGSAAEQKKMVGKL